ncbi:hypothetical protein GPSY_2625 [Paraglaciecola psychrophila 170]|nr:hypothetical protein GPSY_2625 [Paraglaciecola psychrophila 170]
MAKHSTNTGFLPCELNIPSHTYQAYRYYKFQFLMHCLVFC